MICVSQLILNPESHMVQKELYHPYEMHRTLMRGFREDRATSNMLHRVEFNPYTGQIAVLVQATAVPDWQPLQEVGQGDYLLHPPAPAKTIDQPLAHGRVLRFRLRANPTKRLSSGKGNKPGKRIELYKEEDQLAWLHRQAERHGFQLLAATTLPQGKESDWVKRPEKSHKLTLFTVQYEGILRITDTAAFHTALTQGIGPAKAFGCGLLSLAPA